MKRYRATLLSLLVTATALALPVATVSAAPAPNYGSTVNCRYRVTQGDTYGWTEALLNRFVVKPPTIYAKNGTQQVGWQFIVRRSLDRWYTPWVVTYRSQVQQRVATTTTPADFDTMRVGVSVPTNVEDQQHVWYTVTLKVFWYAANGSIASMAKSTFADYGFRVDGEQGATDEYCEGLARQYFD